MQPRLGGCDKSGKDYRPPITTEWFCIAFRVWVFFWSFLGAMPNPSLGCFFLVGSCLSCLGSFFLPFLGAMPNPSLGCSCSSGAAFRVCVVFFCFLGGDAKSLAWVLLALWVPNHPVFLGSNHPLTCVQHLLSFTIWIDWRDSSWWTWIGQTAIWGNGMGISTKWFFNFVSFHCDRFMNSTSQPLQNGSCDFETFFWHLY